MTSTSTPNHPRLEAVRAEAEGDRVFDVRLRPVVVVRHAARQPRRKVLVAVQREGRSHEHIAVQACTMRLDLLGPHLESLTGKH